MTYTLVDLKIQRVGHTDGHLSQIFANQVFLRTINQSCFFSFLFQGVGIDDMFVMIASWRKTDHYASAENRMPEAFAEAAISITITSGNLCIQIT